MMNKKETAVNLLETRPHFEILDGLRGIAAVVVVVFHFMEIAITDYSRNIVAHGYLAVDFFFCLSGFVIAYAYDHRAPQMGFVQFAKLRLIRLQPLVVIGTVLGLFTFLVDPFSDFYGTYGFGKTTLLFLSSICLIPYPVMPERYFNLFSLNAPAWSLFWEYIANLFYILVLFKISKKILLPLVLIALVAICYVAKAYGNLSGGWGGENFFVGAVRVSFSFLLGMLIYRSNWIIKNKLGFLGVGILLLLGFLVPYRDNYNWLIEPILVLFYFPLLVALGAGTKLSPSFKRITKLSGDISYPLYMTHYPFVWVFLTYVLTVKPPMSLLAIVIPVSVIALLILAYLIMLFVDQPIRKYFTNALKKDTQALKSAIK